MDGAPAMTRREAVDLADRCLAHVEALVAAHPRAHVAVGSGSVSLFAAIRQHLRQSLADHLQNADAERPVVLAAKRWAERQAYTVKERLEERLVRAQGLGAWMTPIARGRAVRVLALPKTKHHLRDQILVAEHGRKNGTLDVRFVTFARAHAEELRTRGLDAVLAGAYAPIDLGRYLLTTTTLGGWARWVARPAPGVDKRTWRKIAALIYRETAAQLHPLLIAADAIGRATEELAPEVILVGNPVTTEGSLGVVAAEAKHVPSIALQHGDFNAAHAEWAASGVSMITAWGDGPAEVLTKLGVPRDRIAVTGAPWADGLQLRARGPHPSGRKQVLVALSGAGHAVGLAEHTAEVRRLLEASAKLDDVDLVFRLHPKDRPDLYLDLLAEIRGSRAEIVEARQAGEIHDALPTFDLVVTVTSTSAVDAMLHGIPVLTLDRPEGEVHPAFVDSGATTRVKLDEPLAARVREVLTSGQGEPIAGAAARYVERFFGARDGRATARVTALIGALAGRSADTRS